MSRSRRTGSYFIDNFSTPDTPTTAVLRDTTGKLVARSGEGRRLAAQGGRLAAARAVRHKSS